MIIDLQRKLTEVGRIRIGQQVESKGRGGKRPAKLDTFRLTSPDRTRIEYAARLYGGTVRQWEAPAGPQWEVITTVDALPVVVPPTAMAFTQSYELWSGGGCLRRCNGVVESLSDGPCLCDPENRECKIHSRLSVMLRDLPGLGVWRIDSSGYYAGIELPGALEIVELAAGRGQMLPAVLRLEQRMIKRADETVKRFAVPVLDLMVSPAQLMSGGDPLDAGTLAIEPPAGIDGTAEYLTPVPATVPEQPVPSIAEQAAAEKPKRKPRKNAAKKLPSTGVRPRTATQAAQDARQADSKPQDPGPPTPGPPAELPPDEPPPDDEGPLPERTKMNRHMHALFRTAGIDKDQRENRLTITRYVSKQYDIESSNDLTDTQLRDVITKMSDWDRDGVIYDRCNDILDQAAIDASQEQPQEES